MLRYSRPQTLNALDVAIRREMAEHLTALADDDEVRVVVLAGTEKAFAAGADISKCRRSMRSRCTAGTPPKVLEGDRAAFPKPLIAAVSGFALGGGCELAMHCDIIIAGQSARFGQPEVKVGIMPGAGGTQRLTRAVGKFRANLYLMTGRIFDAATALNMGLVSEVVADAEVESAALKLAGEIAALPPLSLKFIKEATALADNAPLERRSSSSAAPASSCSRPGTRRKACRRSWKSADLTLRDVEHDQKQHRNSELSARVPPRAKRISRCDVDQGEMVDGASLVCLASCPFRKPPACGKTPAAPAGRGQGMSIWRADIAVFLFPTAESRVTYIVTPAAF